MMMSEDLALSADNLRGLLQDLDRCIGGPATEYLRLARLVEHQATNLMRRTANDVRAEGLTWAEIGAALGVSKQAAQQRYGFRPF